MPSFALPWLGSALEQVNSDCIQCDCEFYRLNCRLDVNYHCEARRHHAAREPRTVPISDST